jgi:hypothetical protein
MTDLGLWDFLLPVYNTIFRAKLLTILELEKQTTYFRKIRK